MKTNLAYFRATVTPPLRCILRAIVTPPQDAFPNARNAVCRACARKLDSSNNTESMAVFDKLALSLRHNVRQ